MKVPKNNRILIPIPNRVNKDYYIHDIPEGIIGILVAMKMIEPHTHSWWPTGKSDEEKERKFNIARRIINETKK